MQQKTLKTYLALAVMAAAVSMAAGARQLSQIDIPETGERPRRRSRAGGLPGLTEPLRQDLLSTGVELGTSVFVPSLSFLDLGSVFTGLLQGPVSWAMGSSRAGRLGRRLTETPLETLEQVGAAGGFLDEGLQPLCA